MRIVLPVLLVFATTGGALHAADELPADFVRSPSQYPEPGLSFGASNGLPAPKTLLYSASAEEILADIDEWRLRGVDGFLVSGTGGGWQDNIWAVDGEPWTIGESDKRLQQVRQASEACAQYGMETFALMAFSKTFDWFDDVAWQHINHNFRQFAIFAREAKCKGVAIDIEYIMPQYSFDWKGYDLERHPREEIVKAMRERMAGVAAAMYDEFPDMVFLTLPELDFRLGTHIQLAWVEEAARRQAPGGIHYLMGYCYRNHNVRYVLGRAWLNNELFQRLLSDEGRAYWKEKCSLAGGVWPFGIPEYLGHGPELTPEEMRHGIAATLLISRSYNWYYVGRCKDQLLKRKMEEYTRKEDIQDYIDVMAAQEVIVTPKYVELAKEIRDLKLRDYSEDLGLYVEASILGPQDSGRLEMEASPTFSPRDAEMYWQCAIDRFWGRTVNLEDRFQTRKDWMVIGPFPNEGVDFKGHHAVYPPEESIDLTAEYDGLGGKVRWQEVHQDNEYTSVDLTQVFETTDQVCAYALCYVKAEKPIQAQVRLGTNDSGKLWVGGKLLLDYPNEGGAILDRNVVPVTLPAGTTPVLLKVCNGGGQWGFVFRITDQAGHPLKKVEYSLAPPVP